MANKRAKRNLTLKDLLGSEISLDYDNFLQIPGVSEHQLSTWSIHQLLQNKNNLDTNPPYQRGFVWKNSLKEALIKSIFKQVPLGAMHLVEKSKEQSHEKWVLDAKQRTQTVIEFSEDGFTVALPGKDGRLYSLYWSEIKENYPAIASKFEEYSFQVIIWKPMSVEAQRGIFEMVNNSMPLTKDEKRYCIHYNTQKFFQHLHQKLLVKSGCDRFLNAKLRKNSKFSVIKLLHSILMTTSGPKFDEMFEIRDLSGESLTRSAEAIEAYLAKNGITANIEFNTNVMKNLGWSTLTKELNFAFSSLKKIMLANNMTTKGKDLEACLFLDLICWLIKHYQSKAFTPAYIGATLKSFHSLVLEWISTKEKRLKMKTTDKVCIEERIKELDTLAIKHNISLGKKKRPLSKHQKLQAALQANSVCPITGELLTDDNVQFDHVQPKSTNSESESMVLSERGNRIKGCAEPKDIEKLNELLNKTSG